MHDTISMRAATVLDRVFTAMKPKPNPDSVVPGSTESRDEMQESEWFPVFRSGDYPQGKFTKSDVDQMAEEWLMSGRRAPIVFDHLTKADFAENAKPGSAAGYIIEARAVDETDPRYLGERVLECRAKVGWSARYYTREGSYRNCSIGIGNFKCRDSKKRFGIHHLALLGAAPAGVDGLPEVIFSESSSEIPVTVLSFSQMDATASPNQESSMINFADHQAALDKQKTELTAKFSADLEAAQAETAAAEKAAEEAEAAKVAAEAAAAAAEAEKAAAEAAKVEAEKVAETAKADVVVKVEEAKQEADKAGFERGQAEAERRFNADSEKSEVTAFCLSLFKAGKVTEQDSKSLPDTILTLPAGEHRDRFRSLLESRPGVPGAVSTFSAPVGVDPESKGSELSDEQAVEKGRELMAQFPTKFSSIVEASIAAKANYKSTKETV